MRRGSVGVALSSPTPFTHQTDDDLAHLDHLDRNHRAVLRLGLWRSSAPTIFADQIDHDLDHRDHLRDPNRRAVPR